MDLLEWRNELSLKSKNGVSFLASGVIVWGIITILFLQSFEINMKNLFALYATGLTFPLAVMISKIMKVDWKAKSNPLGNLGLIFNLAQFIYFPLIIWAFISNPNDALVFFAIITSAHFFPYGWLYNTKVYYILSPIMALLVFFIGLNVNGDYLWVIPLTMVVLLVSLNLFLLLDYKKKASITSALTKDFNY